MGGVTEPERERATEEPAPAEPHEILLTLVTRGTEIDGIEPPFRWSRAVPSSSGAVVTIDLR